jgi:KaiC/GvpD/RAD55 family RecA-like ATPase
MIFAMIVAAPPVSSQVADTHYITLYAHTSGNSSFLNTLAQWGGPKAADVSNELTFKLTPALGRNLHIYGSISATIYLRGSTSMFARLVLYVAEMKSTGQTVQVPGANIESPVSLDSQRPLPFTLGVGIIEYEFSKDSSILLRVRVEAAGAKGIPYLVWDGASVPTSLRIPGVSPMQATTHISSTGLQYDRIFRTDSASGTIKLNFSANVTDALGISRFTRSLATLTTADGASIAIEPIQKATSTYTATYFFAALVGVGKWDLKLELVDTTGDHYAVTDTLWVSPFYNVRIRVTDSSGTPLENAMINVTCPGKTSWSAFTNSSGWAALSLPSSDVLGPLNVTITMFGVRTLPSSMNVVGDSTFRFQLSVYDIRLRIVMNGIPLPDANVKLTQGDNVIAEGKTGLDGIIILNHVPAGNYTARIQYLFSEYQAPVEAESNTLMTIDVPLPHPEVVGVLILIAGFSILAVVWRRRAKRYRQSFSYFNQLTSGGLPQACFVIIAGNSGSGKSVLLQSLAAEHLESGSSVYLTNTEYPATILRNMDALGVLDSESNRKNLLFVDAYSALGGKQSEEEYNVASPTDLTSIGLNISKCLEKSGSKADVYLDSLNPMLSALRIEYVLSFLQSIAAKVKANDGKLCVTVGTGIERSELMKLEEVADCVIETQLQDLKKGQRRRLRIRKLRGKPYVDRWVDFQVESGTGIVFFSRTKPGR